MNKKLIVKQTGFRDCACACLLSIIRFYGGNVSKEELTYLINTDNYGTNAYNMIEGMKTLGFHGYGKKVCLSDIFKEKNNLPFIAHIKMQNNFHYVVVYNINQKKKYFEIMDPSFGYKKAKYNELEKIYLNTILVFKKIKEIPCLNEKEELLQYIISILKSEIKLIIKVFCLSIVITIFSLINSLYMKISIDYLLKDNKIKYLLIALILFSFCILLKNLLSYLREHFARQIENKISKSLNFKVINHLFNIPYRYFNMKPSGELASRINDLENVKEFINNVVLSIFLDVLVTIISFIFLFYISYKLSFFVIVNIILYLLVVLIYKGIFKKSIFDLQIINSDYQSGLIENLNSYETIRNLNCINSVVNNLSYKYNKYLNRLLNLKKKLSTESFIKNILYELGILLIFSYGTYEVLNNSITLGDLLGFSAINMFFMDSLRNLMNFIVNYVFSLTSYRRINELLLIKSDPISEKNNYITGDIVFKNLCYVLNDKYLFKNLNFEIKSKYNYIISGSSGSGKSTIMKILKKYIENYEGNIFIDGNNLKDISKERIYSSILYVSQNENLFNETIKNNIINYRNISQKKYNEVIKLINIDKIISSKLFREEEVIEENGFNLSGGERQKLILARSLLKQFNYLILDEALSEVDEQEERLILKNIIEKYKDKTIIYISHKKNVEDLFDRKVYIERKCYE